MVAARRPPKAYRVQLVFRSGPAFTCVEQANTIPQALDQAMRYARALGFCAELKKRFVNEIEQEATA